MSAARLLGAGLAAGVVDLVIGITGSMVLDLGTLQESLRAHGLRVIGEPSDAIPHTLVRLLLGVVVTLLYVCIRPRFGAHAKTALVTGVFAWALSYLYTAWTHVHIGLYPPSLGASIAAWGLGELVVVAWVGGWIALGRAGAGAR